MTRGGGSRRSGGSTRGRRDGGHPAHGSPAFAARAGIDAGLRQQGVRVAGRDAARVRLDARPRPAARGHRRRRRASRRVRHVRGAAARSAGARAVLPLRLGLLRGGRAQLALRSRAGDRRRRGAKPAADTGRRRGGRSALHRRRARRPFGAGGPARGQGPGDRRARPVEHPTRPLHRVGSAALELGRRAPGERDRERPPVRERPRPGAHPVAAAREQPRADLDPRPRGVARAGRRDGPAADRLPALFRDAVERRDAPAGARVRDGLRRGLLPQGRVRPGRGGDRDLRRPAPLAARAERPPQPALPRLRARRRGAVCRWCSRTA